ncbi:AAA family ATPase, partial [Phocaeicola dorei]
MYKITLKNIKSINYLEFSFPDKNGVYLLTGGNGCGKTTLLIALNRLGDNLAFSKNIKTSTAGFDSFRDAQIIYSTEHDSVIYHRAGIRWVPTPRSKSNLIKTFPCQNILYLSTSGLRFYAQEPKDLKDQRHNAVSDEIINPLNDILNTSKFNDLKYIKIKSPKGKQRHLHRDNKLYVI